MNKIIKKIKNLQNQITYHNYLYFCLDKPIISDIKYDYLLNKLKNLEKKINYKKFINSPTYLIGSSIFKKSKFINHLTPMLSLENIFNKKKFLNFYKKMLSFSNKKKIRFCCEFKFDGVAVNLIYINGVLKQASTRGDGKKGEDVTKNVFFIKSIPLVLHGKNFPKIMEIRGELFILKKDFLSLNKQNNIINHSKFSNARNLASGLLRRKNLEFELKKKLLFICHGFELFNYFKNIDSYYLNLLKIKNWGFNISTQILLCSSKNKILNFFKKIKNLRSTLKFEIDGIVIKVDSLKLRKKIGLISRSPRWAIAYKFPNEVQETKLLKVKFQVGRTGVITPVGYFKSVNISGIKIKKASIYNNKELKKLDLCIGDRIFICRAGDVIPKILKKKKYDTNTILNKKVLFPKKCPSCLSVLKSCSKENNFYCTNSFFCLPQIQKKIIHFFSKNAFKIKGLSPHIINQLIKKNNFRSPIDFFKLNFTTLKSLNNVGQKTANNILNSFKKFKYITLEKFIFSFGIKGIGKSVSYNLASSYRSLKNLLKIQKKNILNIPGIGELIYQNLINFLSNSNNLNIIDQLINNFNIKVVSKKNQSLTIKKSIFYQKNILITGQLKNFSRIEMKEKLENLGGIVKNYISKNIDLVILGKNPGKKFIYAINFKKKILTEDKVLKIFSKI
ncbi:NAD-dependent DNA ligase LigA [Buchnera aphidicola]|uniref:NAD-dependent DNA ligase LigA n=1 Tax=Buchnera aphidicola TaxID=9 RepID=UPI00223779B7|nr:NAD-dependent DNA ligase LigA [Buchnera aphidicola]MCW5197374.1 NAD-dependent DNA ligase LigA [Buchnera aphidicola (Chaitophorus viminalis)]